MKSALCAARLAVVLPLAACAQRLRLETDSLPAVQARARQQGRLLLVGVLPPEAAGLSAGQRQRRSSPGFDEPEVARAFGPDVLVKEVAFDSRPAREPEEQYGITTYPAYLYFAPDGTLLHRRFGRSVSAAPYVQDLAAARRELANPRNLGYYAAGYAQGNREIGFLRDYLARRQQLGQVVAPALLDAYAEQLPARTFSQGAAVKYLLELGPPVGSRTYQLTHLNQPLADSLYRALPLAERVALHNRITARTSRQAVATRSVGRRSRRRRLPAAPGNPL